VIHGVFMSVSLGNFFSPNPAFQGKTEGRQEDQQMFVTDIQKTERLTTPSGKSVWWLLSREIGTPNFEMRYFEVEKGIEGMEESHPFEHEIFVIKGKGVIKSGQHEVKIQEGDAIYVAPNELHQFFNLGEESLGFICIIPNGCEDHLKESS